MARMLVSTILVVAALVLSSASCGVLAASSGVMGIDLGTEFIKVGGVKSGNIDIVLNEQSHRKSAHWLGFRGDDRFFAEEAKNFAARFPMQMASGFNRMVGIPFEETSWLEKDLHLYFNISQNEATGSVQATFGPGGQKNKNNTYRAEDALGMMFHHLRQIAEKDLEQTTRDAVVVVPSFFTARQSQAVIDAAAIGGVKIVTLLQSNTATGLMYGIQRRGFEKETYIVIYDMGASKTEVSLLQYSVPPPEPAAGKKNKIKMAHRMGIMQVVRHVSDSTLGGRLFDVCLGELLEAQFNVKNPTKVGPIAQAKKDAKAGTPMTTVTRKGLISLFRAANKAKEVLGSNKFASVTVEGIVQDKDFNTQITRPDFERHCEPLFKRSADVLQKLLDEGGVDKSDIEALEMMGGAARIPKLIDDLGSVFGKPASRTINGDEAAALGATYFASTLAESIRVKSFKVRDVFSRNISFTLSPKPGADASEESANTRPLFINSPAPSRKSVTVARNEDFDMTVFATDNEGKRQNDFTVSITGLKSALNNSGYFADEECTLLKHPNNTHSVKVELRASEANVVTVEKATLTIKYATNVSKKVKITEEDEEPKAGGESTDAPKEGETAADTIDADATKDDAPKEDPPAQAEEDDSEEEKSEDDAADKKDDPEGDAEKKSEDATEEKKDEKEATTDKKDAKDEKKDDKKEKKEVKYKSVKTVVMQKRDVTLKVKIAYTEPKPFGNDAIGVSRSLMKRLEGLDTEKRELAAARNDLEAYILFIRGEGFFESQDVLDAVNQENQTEVKEVLDKVAEWFDDAGDVTFKGTFLIKLEELRKVVKKVLPIEMRKKAVLKSSGEEKKKDTSSSSSDDSSSTKKKKKSKKDKKDKSKPGSRDSSKKADKKKKDSKKDSKKETKKDKTKKKEPRPDTTEEL